MGAIANIVWCSLVPLNVQLVAQNAIFFDPPAESDPNHFNAFVAQTQAVQALCIKTQSEFYRAQRNTSGG